MNIEQIQSISQNIKSGIEKVIIGKSENIDFILTAIFSGGHILLEDVPGTGKTMLAKSLARCVDGSFARIQFTPDLLPSDHDRHQFLRPGRKQGPSIFRPGPAVYEHCCWPTRSTAPRRGPSPAFWRPWRKRQVTVDGIRLRTLPHPFFVIATQNPGGDPAGTFPLPEAQLDRFSYENIHGAAGF